LIDACRWRRFNALDRRNTPAIDGSVLKQAGAVAATLPGPDQPFEVVTLPPIEPTLSVDAVLNGRASIDLDPFCGSPAKHPHDRLLCRIPLHTLGVT